MTKHISHTCGRRSCRPARYLSSSTHSHTSKRCLATARVSSSITTGYYVLNKDVDPKRLGSGNNAMKNNTTSSDLMTPLVLLQRIVAVAAASFVFILHELFILRLSEIRPIPWFLNEGQVEGLVDPSTWIAIFEPRTNDRNFVNFICLQSYVRILLLVHHLVCKGHARISNVPPHSTVSSDWVHESMGIYMSLLFA